MSFVQEMSVPSGPWSLSTAVMHKEQIRAPRLATVGHAELLDAVAVIDSRSPATCLTSGAARLLDSVCWCGPILWAWSSWVYLLPGQARGSAASVEGQRGREDRAMESVESIEAEATEVASEIGAILTHRGLTVAVAESLTGGKLANQFAATEGSGEWFTGAVVAYQSAAKQQVLGVPSGPVISEQAVISMVEGVTSLFGADCGVAASGAGGPEGQEGQAPGTTWIAAGVSGTVETELHYFSGEPLEILAQTQLHSLELLRSLLHKHEPSRTGQR